MRRSSACAEKGFTLTELLVLMGIVVVLAAMLVPMLAEVRERARRTACIANLEIIGRALASYTADYGGYVPCNPALWTTSFNYCRPTRQIPCLLSWGHENAKHEWYRKPYRIFDNTSHKSWPESAQATYWASLKDDSESSGTTGITVPVHKDVTKCTYFSLYRCIGGGQKSWARGTLTNQIEALWDNGKLNAMPNGLGMLLTADYLTDARVFYCPSSSSLSPTFQAPSIPANNRCADTPDDWRNAGGFDKRTLHYGNWSASINAMGSISGRSVMLSSYNYRNVPLSNFRPWHRTDAGPNAEDPNAEIYLPGTKSRVYPEVCGPLFKTDKVLGGRAIACDTFDKGLSHDAWGQRFSGNVLTPEETARHPGYGWFGHRDSYNVLFGDGSVRVFADPGEKVIWHRSGHAKDVTQYQDALSGLNNYVTYTSFSGLVGGPGGRGTTPTQVSVGNDVFANSGNGMWHELDVFGGRDPDVR
jgi:prepilin-type processing-associated H-X9-DG protein